ncbi:cyclase [Arenicella chitinivorans]|uniref:Cyclase n=1 Tax=Arenicella chitinivorans TaxID=1329800 RepID=A0A918VQ26_9GAMM|nr:MBL fold metallo-hydrolase [Arenicella chitinivorans]GHA15856.1 cyclase [Arenicella chitinivorans]
MQVTTLFRTAATSAVIALLILPLRIVSADEVKLHLVNTKVSDRIYMLRGEGGFTGGNVALSIGEDGVAMIDNGISSVLEMLRAETRKITDQPIDYLINTHVHGDHTGNNFAYGSDGTRIISHENLRTALVKQGVETESGKQPTPKASLPVLTFSDRMTIHINGDQAKIIHFAHAHTDGDAIVYFAGDNVIHTGDIMFNKVFPYIDESNGGSLRGAIKALQSIHEMSNDDTKIIPGHGPLATKADIKRTIDMMQDSLSLVQALADDGQSDEEILAANPLSKYQEYHWGFITTERMTKQVISAVRSVSQKAKPHSHSH